MWKLSVTTNFEAEDAVAELLGRIFSGGVATYIQSDTTHVAVYRKSRPAKLSARFADLREGLARIKKCGLELGRGKITVRTLQRQDWAESWKRHFRPIDVGDALLIKPSWSKHRPRKGQEVIVLDPGMSFGTGHHPTTLFCLRELAARQRAWDRGAAGGICKPSRCYKRRSRFSRRSFLDLGTGSGILAIAAVKLGYTPVHAIDSDAESIRVARANARANRVSGKIRIARQNLSQLPLKSGRRYDLICANLLTTLLVTERERIVGRLKPGGILVAAGILKSEFNLLVGEYALLGLRLLADRTQGEWRSGAFVW